MRPIHRTPHIAEGQPFCQRVDRLDQRQRGKPGFVDHPVGMHHLQHAVIEFGGAGDVAQFADRQELLQIVLACVEIGEGEVAGIVVSVNAIGRTRTMRRRGPVLDRP